MYDVYFEDIVVKYNRNKRTPDAIKGKERFIVTHPDSKHVGKFISPTEITTSGIKGIVDGEIKEIKFYYWQIDVCDEQGRARNQKYNDSLGRDLNIGDQIYMIAPCPWGNNLAPEISVIRNITEKEGIELEVLMRDGIPGAEYFVSIRYGKRTEEERFIRTNQVPTKMLKVPLREDEVSFLILNGYQVD